jgi:hypothetical protein
MNSIKHDPLPNVTDQPPAIFKECASYHMTPPLSLTRIGLDIHRMMAELIGE